MTGHDIGKDKAKQLQLYKIIIFGAATTFLFIKGHYYPPSFYSQWQPISFYRLLDQPLPPGLLRFFEWGWFILSMATALSCLKAPQYFRALAKVASIFAVIYLGHDYNFGTIYHGTQLYLGVLLILAFAPMNKKEEQQQYFHDRWHIPLIKFFITFMLFGAGMQKLVKGGLSWVFSDALFIKLALLPSHTWAATQLLQAPLWVFEFLAFIILFGVQLSAPLALFHRTIGIGYFILWSCFHLGATYIFSVGSTFYSQIFCYSLFLPLYALTYKGRSKSQN